jgi:NDP-sugar pyrophosphorylase family protein
LFDNVENVWEVLPGIEEFIRNFGQSEESKEYTEVSENLYVGRGVVMDNTSRIDGPAIIGHNSIIGHAALLRGGVLLGHNVNVGHATEVKHSIILSDTALAHLNYVGDSVVGSNCNISGGATFANWRFDKKEVMVKSGDEKIVTHLEKLGSIVGDESFIGVNAVLNPGTILAKKSLVFPLMSVKGTHRESTTFK